MNSIAITGRLTETPELKTSKSGKTVCAFRVAVPRPKIKDVTDFFTCVAWERNAEFVAHYFIKGQKIEINGILTTRSYEKEGKKHILYEILCETLNFGESKQTADSTPTENISGKQDDEDFSEVSLSDDDLPF